MHLIDFPPPGKPGVFFRAGGGFALSSWPGELDTEMWHCQGGDLLARVFWNLIDCCLMNVA